MPRTSPPPASHRAALLVALALLPLSAPALGQDAPPPPAGTPSITAHALSVTLDPEKGSLEATDRMTVRRNGGGDLVFDLRADMAIRLLEVDGTRQESMAREPKDPRPGRARYRVALSPRRETAVVALSYGGVVREDVDRAKDLAFVVGDHSGGTISPEGVFLGEGTGWVPLDDSMATFAVTATVPEGWSVATQGGVPDVETKEGRTTFASAPSIPCDGLWLQAGRWKVDRRTTRSGIPIATCLSEGNAALSPVLLDAVEGYLAVYAKLLGPYPHAKFDIVENFFSTGYGMPSATLLGGDVIAHMGMMAQRSGGKIPSGYLDHELVHGWWGNGVFVDYDRGNWCEALTTYCSNYMSKEWDSAEEAAKHRRGVRARFAARVRPERDYPVRKFTGKTEDFENDIGYGKGSMVFHAVRQAVGDGAFFDALRTFAAEFLGRRASWEDLRAAFEKRSGRNLEAMFHQALDRTGAPVLTLRDCAAAATADGWRVTGTIVQAGGDPWTLPVPLVIQTAVGTCDFTVDVSQGATSFDVRSPWVPTRVLLDPDSHLWRGYAPGEVPATLDATLHDGGRFELLVECTSGGGGTESAVGEGFQSIEDAVKARGNLASSTQGSDLFAPDPSSPGDHSALVLESLGNAGNLGPWLSTLHPPVRIKGKRLTVAGQSFEGDDVALLVSSRQAAHPDRFVTLYGGMSEAALAGARRIFFYGGEGVVVFKAGRPVLRLEAEGEESSRAALLEGLLPEAAPDRAGAMVASLCEPGVAGRLSGTPAGAKALDLVERTLRDEDGLAVLRQPFSFEVAEWDGSACLSMDGTAWEGGTPFCFSAASAEARAATPVLLGRDATLERFLADLRAAQEGGAEGVMVLGPPEPPAFLADYLVFPSTLPEKARARAPGVDPALTVEGMRSRLLPPGFEVTIPVVYLGQEPERSALPSRVRAAVTRRKIETANVFAVIPGSDPALVGEAVLLGCHHDHLGPGYPGANDDASGVAAVREAARILAAHRGTLRRPVVVAFFGAEEWGLRGSRWFVAHRPDGVPRIAAALTLDTVGQKGYPEVNVVGETVYPALAGPMARCLLGAGLAKGRDIDRFAFAHGSDHYALHAAGIPAVDLFSGDYGILHTPQDAVETVDPAKLARLARAAAAWIIDRSRAEAAGK